LDASRTAGARDEVKGEAFPKEKWGALRPTLDFVPRGGDRLSVEGLVRPSEGRGLRARSRSTRSQDGPFALGAGFRRCDGVGTARLRSRSHARSPSRVTLNAHAHPHTHGLRSRSRSTRSQTARSRQAPALAPPVKGDRGFAGVTLAPPVKGDRGFAGVTLAALTSSTQALADAPSRPRTGAGPGRADVSRVGRPLEASSPSTPPGRAPVNR
jgi:hypothetical protein